MTRSAEILSPATLARIEFTCDMLGVSGKEAEMIAQLCQMSRVEGYIAGIDEGLGILKGKPNNVVDFDIERAARIYEGCGDAPSDTTPGGSAA